MPETTQPTETKYVIVLKTREGTRWLSSGIITTNGKNSIRHTGTERHARQWQSRLVAGQMAKVINSNWRMGAKVEEARLPELAPWER